MSRQEEHEEGDSDKGNFGVACFSRTIHTSRVSERVSPRRFERFVLARQAHE